MLMRAEVVKNADDSLTISFDNGETITVDCLIWAIGRAANTSGFGLEKTGKLTEKEQSMDGLKIHLF